jgi:DNA invertase Pin-like site-specific DNA recombinase
MHIHTLGDSLPAAKVNRRGISHHCPLLTPLERSLIAKRVKGRLRNARDKGKHLRRPRVIGDAARVGALRIQRSSWRGITPETGVTARELASDRWLACRMIKIWIQGVDG